MNKLTSLSNSEIRRYSRHLILEQVGLEGQQRLKASSVLCVGTGGLGAPLLMYLAAAGVGRIGIVDFDVVDESNLQRQVIHGTTSVGRSKVQSAVERIADINPHVRVDVYEEAFTAVNALDIATKYDVIVDGTDNFPTRYLVNDVCEILGKPNVYGSVFKFEGQASVFNYQGGPTYRDLYPEPPPPGMVPNCAEGGVLGVLPGLIGLIQATETIKILLGLGKTLSGRLLLYDAVDMRFRELRLPKRVNAKPVTELIDYVAFCGFPGADAHVETENGGYGRISVTTAKEKLDAGWNPYVLDVRKAFEADIVQLNFTDRLHPHETILDIVTELPNDRDILVYCRTGVRSANACTALRSAGLTRIFNLEGGIIAWAQEIAPELPVY
ncbi:MAG: molybdopterin-synthase adenylyltransferase MoeB [Candidatus Promineifilaceae bacterium]